jgi:3-oxoacyl-(acyl-carrier-protein) synthase
MIRVSLEYSDCEPIVVTGIGLTTSVGGQRESAWRAIRQGRSGIGRVCGLTGLPDGLIVGGTVPLENGNGSRSGQLKAITLCETAAAEAVRDANLDFSQLDVNRFGCAISGHMGDTVGMTAVLGIDQAPAHPVTPWWQQWMPNTGCSVVANRYGLRGPRFCHSTACASGLIDVLAAVRSIRSGQCDIALCGSGEAIHPLFAAGFHQMKVLAWHEQPEQASRPFDRARNGFVMGEGAAMLVLERLSHARRRGARIYAELLGGKMLAEAHHVTGLDEESDALAHLIRITLADAGLGPSDIGYINAHGTATIQNDVMECRAIRKSFGPAAERVCLSSIKSMLGHLVNASGSVELALTTLALRDGFAPPTINLTDQDPDCDLDCLPLVGRRIECEHALKLSVAFGGHLAAAVVRRWDVPGEAAGPASLN